MQTHDAKKNLFDEQNLRLYFYKFESSLFVNKTPACT